MQQLDLLDSQAQLIAASISGRVARIHEALHQLAAMSSALFEATPDDPAAIEAWLKAEGFCIDPKGGFFEREAHLTRIRARSAEGQKPDPAIDPMSFLWPPSRAENPTTRHHLYAQRGLGPILQAMHGRFPDVVWIYYQDDTNATIIAPAMDGVTAIPPEFDWHGYHSFTAAEPSQNPERALRWSPPNIDYGGQGLILCASMPVYHRDQFVGIWSMDVPLNSVLQGVLSTLPLAAKDGFLATFDGHLVAHRSIEAVIAQEGGSVYRERIDVLGGGFKELDLAPLIAKGHGRIELAGEGGRPLVVFYKTVPDIGWISFLTVDPEELMAARTRALSAALDRVREGDLSLRLDFEKGDELDTLGQSYNAMAASLAAEVEARAAAERALRDHLAIAERQREELAALSAPVIEVGEGVLAVPLVGSVEEDRARHLTARVLSDVARLRARTVVVDLTGAASLDATAADDLLRLGGAVRLLGARCVFSGISPDLSAMLAGGSLDLEQIEAYGTLKAALAGALGDRRR
jgi:anti-anti-sigma regulatory factor